MRQTNNKFIIVVSCLNTLFLILTLLGKYNSNILACLSLYLIIFLPKILRKVLKIKIPYLIELIFLIFVFLAQLLGSIMHFYDNIYWYDSLVHLTSGILTSFLAIYLLILFNKYDKHSIGFNVLYMFSITLLIASCWEFFEFASDNLLGGNAQRVIATGVKDTMKDMICALLGCSLVVIDYIYESTNKTKLLIINFIKKIKEKSE